MLGVSHESLRALRASFLLSLSNRIGLSRVPQPEVTDIVACREAIVSHDVTIYMFDSRGRSLWDIHCAMPAAKLGALSGSCCSPGSPAYLSCEQTFF